MKNSEIRKYFSLLSDRDGKVVYLHDELRTLFGKRSLPAFNQALATLVGEGTLQRLNRGVYYYPHHHLHSNAVIAQAIAALRHGHYTYLSLESALSEYGIISQIPFRLTFMTTGRSGVMDTPLGIFEFTHTKRSAADILQQVLTDAEYWRAPPEMALRDLRRVGRNTHLLDEEALREMCTKEEDG